jgi:general secretion pathway protein L
MNGALAELKALLAVWITAVAAAVNATMARIRPQPRIRMVEGEDGRFTACLVAAPKGAVLPDLSFHVAHDRCEPTPSAEWRTVLRGSRIELLLRPDQVLFRTLDFPRQAADFLDGMVRAQIDRLTPWAASEALFGITAAATAPNDRIAVTLAATARQRIEPLLRLASGFGATSIAGIVEVSEAGRAAQPIKLFETVLAGAGSAAIDIPRLLRLTLVGAAAAAALTLAITGYVGGRLEAEQQGLQQRIAQRRAALRIAQPGGSAETLLARRKQTSPSSVMVLEAVSRALPDTTYVTELRIEADKMQVVGLTQDAPSLIRLLEQSPQFTRATFFAPTTRGQSDPGERFHIEAHITPYFGSGS